MFVRFLVLIVGKGVNEFLLNILAPFASRPTIKIQTITIIIAA